MARQCLAGIAESLCLGMDLRGSEGSGDFSYSFLLVFLLFLCVVGPDRLKLDLPMSPVQ